MTKLKKLQTTLENQGVIIWHGDINEPMLSEIEFFDMGFWLVLGGMIGSFEELSAIALLVDVRTSVNKDQVGKAAEEFYYELTKEISSLEAAKKLRFVGPEQENNPGLLQMEILNSDAYQIELRLNKLSSTFKVFLRNYELLMQLLTATQSKEAEPLIWYEPKYRDLSVTQQETIRLLHNYLASAKTLVDHTRRIIKSAYTDTAFFDAYNVEIEKRFVNNDLAQFIENLRNYTLHYTLPIARANNKTRSFVLAKRDLLSWGSWTKKARTFLESKEDEFQITTLVKDYYHQIDEFHDWIAKELLNLHDSELKWLDAMNQKVQYSLNTRPE